MRCMYVDLDGTLLGRGASLLSDGEGNVSIEGVRAIQACMRADVEVVLMSGRRRAQVFEDARLLGQSSFIYEAGACVVLDGEEHWLTGELVPGELSIAEQIERSGAPALLLERYEGRLEYHEPWHVEREVSHLFRGLVDAVRGRCAAGRSTATGICGWWTTASSTAARRRWPSWSTCAAITCCRRARRRRAAVALHRRARGYAREETFAVGDSREDLACATQVDDVLAGGERRRARPLDPRDAGEVWERARVRGRTRGGRVRGGREQFAGLIFGIVRVSSLAKMLVGAGPPCPFSGVVFF